MQYGSLNKHKQTILLLAQKGETYASIARRYGCTYQAIQNMVKRNGQVR